MVFMGRNRQGEAGAGYRGLGSAGFTNFLSMEAAPPCLVPGPSVICREQWPGVEELHGEDVGGAWVG